MSMCFLSFLLLIAFSWMGNMCDCKRVQYPEEHLCSFASFYECEVMPHSLFQCSVEALDGFNVRIAYYPKTYVVFLKKFH